MPSDLYFTCCLPAERGTTLAFKWQRVSHIEPYGRTTSYLIDSNVWLALTWDRHPQHVLASGWYGSSVNTQNRPYMIT